MDLRGSNAGYLPVDCEYAITVNGVVSARGTISQAWTTHAAQLSHRDVTIIRALVGIIFTCSKVSEVLLDTVRLYDGETVGVETVANARNPSGLEGFYLNGQAITSSFMIAPSQMLQLPGVDSTALFLTSGGPSQGVTIPAGFPFQVAFTIEFWIRIPNSVPTPSQRRTLFYQQASGGGTLGIFLHPNLTIACGNPSGSNLYATAQLQAETAYLVACVEAIPSIRLYINGQLASESNSSLHSLNPNYLPYYIGFNGTIVEVDQSPPVILDEFAVYDKAVDPFSLDWHYRIGSGVICVTDKPAPDAYCVGGTWVLNSTSVTFSNSTSSGRARQVRSGRVRSD